MSYLVIARKFRPQSFGEVSGQPHVTRTLAHAIQRNKVGHAYIFAGPRGVGKTSVARIFAKALNCTQRKKSGEPCERCVNCLEITQGSNLAVREIDGASHNSVDNVRDLIDSFRALPPPGSSYKIYIIDEVHMFSTSAFNALLKSLEEPPPHTVFILATTEAHKIPETVLSRCQRHDFRAIAFSEIETRLIHVCQTENIEIEREVVRMIARLSEGSMRDAQSLLERVHAFCDGRVDVESASVVLGTVARGALFALSHAIFSRDPTRCVELVAEIFSRGVDPALVLREFAAHFRELLMARFGGERMLNQLGVLKEEGVELLRQVGAIGDHDLQDLAQMAREGCDVAIRGSHPRLALEALIVRMATREPVKSVAQLVAAISSGGLVSAQQPIQTLPIQTRAIQGLATQKPGETSGKLENSVAVPLKELPSETAVSRISDSAPEGSFPDRPNSLARTFEWANFVRSTLNGGARIVAEHLKRLSAKKFEVGPDNLGVLLATGPEFSINSLQQAENAKKLEGLLRGFSGVDRWQVQLQPGLDSGRPESGSMLDEEDQARRQQKEHQKAHITNHPSIKTLQKVFPGSKIEIA